MQLTVYDRSEGMLVLDRGYLREYLLENCDRPTLAEHKDDLYSSWLRV